MALNTDWPAIDVLLPAYNGGAYIREQLQSIIDQDYAGLLRIHVRDDGSSDDTVAVVQQMQALPLPSQRQLHLTQRASGEGGVSHNVSALLRRVQHSADYIALADQDDVWLSYKLRIQMEAMQKTAAALPVLVCTDLTVVDGHLTPLHHSLWQLQKLDPAWAARWQDLLVQNMVTGCTTLFNKAAMAVILPLPTVPGIFHDHWMATAVAYSGQVLPLAEQTVLYRQHGHNVEAAQHFNWAYSWHKLKQLPHIAQRSQHIAAALHQPCSMRFILWHKLRLGLARFFL